MTNSPSNTASSLRSLISFTCGWNIGARSPSVFWSSVHTPLSSRNHSSTSLALTLLLLWHNSWAFLSLSLLSSSKAGNMFLSPCCFQCLPHSLECGECLLNYTKLDVFRVLRILRRQWWLIGLTLNKCLQEQSLISLASIISYCNFIINLKEPP